MVVAKVDVPEFVVPPLKTKAPVTVAFVNVAFPATKFEVFVVEALVVVA